MLSFSLATLVLFTALPDDSAVLIGHTMMKSEDGKHEVQLATFGFPMSKQDQKLLLTVMNSDPYLHHFRNRTAYITAGDKSFSSGFRITNWSGYPRLDGKQLPPRVGWTTSFVLPAEVKLVGELKFSYSDGNSRPAKAAFAKLVLSEKDLKAAAIPFQVVVKATGKYHDVLDDNLEVHFVVFVPNHNLPFDDLRMGEAKPRRFPYGIHFGDGKGYRSSRPDECAATFTDAPPKDAAISLKFPGVAGWYKAETIVEKPKKK